MRFEEISLETFVQTYKPIENHLSSTADFDGRLFSTSGVEAEFVQAQKPEHIWLHGEGSDGGTYIWSRWGHVEQIGFFVTQIPVEKEKLIQVLVSLPSYYCENCETEHEDPGNKLWEKFSDIERCPNCISPEELEELDEADNE